MYTKSQGHVVNPASNMEFQSRIIRLFYRETLGKSTHVDKFCILSMQAVGEVERDLIYSDEDEDFSSGEDGGSDSEPTMLDSGGHGHGHHSGHGHHGHHHGHGSSHHGQQQSSGGATVGASGGSKHRFRKSPRSSETGERGGGGSGGGGGGRSKGLASAASAAAAARQRNLKQKFVALLKKFKVTDPEDLEHERVSLDQKLSGGFQFAISRTKPVAHIRRRGDAVNIASAGRFSCPAVAKNAPPPLHASLENAITLWADA